MFTEAKGTALYVRINGMNTIKDEIHFLLICLLHDKLIQDLFPLFWTIQSIQIRGLMFQTKYYFIRNDIVSYPF